MKKVDSESEEEVRPRRREVPRESVSASRTQIQHELQMMRRHEGDVPGPRILMLVVSKMNPWISRVMDTKRKYGLKSLHDAIKKAKMTWKKGHGKC